MNNIFYKGNEKNIGIELFRIVSMLMIIVLHINLCGGLMGRFGTVNASYSTLWFGECSCFACVNCFAIISGYVMVDRKMKLYKIINLWAQVFFISAIIATIWLIWFREGVDLNKILDCYRPLTRSQYWYFTAYFALMFFMPLLNAGINSIGRVTLKKTIVALYFIMTILTILNKADLFKHSNGMSTFWLMIMYIIGGYFGKFGIDTKKYSKLKSALYALICAVALSVWIIIHSYNVGIETGSVKGQWDYLFSTNPLLVLEAIFLLLFFAQLDFKNNAVKKIICFFSASSFSVYLIHVNPLIFDLVFRGRFAWLGDYNFALMALLVILCAIAIYVVCTLLDQIRIFVFKLFLSKLCKTIGEYIALAIDKIIKLL